MFTCHGNRDMTFASPRQEGALPRVRLRLLVPLPLQEDAALNEMAQLVQLQSAQVQELDAECIMLRGCLECVLWPSAPVHPIMSVTSGLMQIPPDAAMSQQQCAFWVSWLVITCHFAASWPAILGQRHV